MTKELEMLNRLTEMTDREEAITIAMKLFPDLEKERVEEIVDEALKYDKKEGLQTKIQDEPGEGDD